MLKTFLRQQPLYFFNIYERTFQAKKPSYDCCVKKFNRCCCPFGLLKILLWQRLCDIYQRTLQVKSFTMNIINNS
ncbi:hypothetical protein JTE90_023543 [Oedothorax gibbosus]|uniref:Uncharacterized protein n=1 Tax=Oedothorax gibbosus TaxID=931172 RepID=A0AAV6UK44_9ARAC|nr:hypothetical protein JTE90_023543 [Oedothorax gibbosus]